MKCRLQNLLKSDLASDPELLSVLQNAVTDGQLFGTPLSACGNQPSKKSIASNEKKKESLMGYKHNQHHTWIPRDKTALTLLSYHDPRTDVRIEQWVHENDVNVEEDDSSEIICFRLDGTQILIDDAREVHALKSTTRRWMERNPDNPTPAMIRAKGAQRQETTYNLERIGVHAEFLPVYDRRHITNG